MPPRQFWTTQHATKLILTLHIGLADRDGNPQGTIKIEDQSGATMVWGGGEFPDGFSSWAFADACRAACEAWELGEAEDVKRAFNRSRSQWVRDAKALLQR